MVPQKEVELRDFYIPTQPGISSESTGDCNVRDCNVRRLA